MCAIYGIITKEPDPSVVGKFFNGFAHLQHRGQESAGVAYTNGKNLWVHKGMGLIQSVFGGDITKKRTDIMDRIIERSPNMIIGQTRYSTSGEKSLRDSPPQYLSPLSGRVALVHNGNLPNAKHDRKRFEMFGVAFDSDHDSELMLRKILYYSSVDRRVDLSRGIDRFMNDTYGTYSAAIMDVNGIYLFRDPWGNRPMFYVDNDDLFFFSSETCALSHIDGEIKEVEPGTILFRSHHSPLKLIRKNNSLVMDKAHCVFEKIYFARPDSRTFSKETERIFRLRLGMKLAMQHPVPDADFISGMPDSGIPAAEGYALQMGKPFISVYVRDKYYLSRNFINPPEERRADKKYHIMEEFVGNKYDFLSSEKVVLIDDSIVRGDTLRDRVRELREAGAKEVHLRISSPKLSHPCYYGIDLPTHGEIIGSSRTTEQIREYMEADSLKYLEEIFVREVLQEFGNNTKNYCMACFNGIYPIQIV